MESANGAEIHRRKWPAIRVAMWSLGAVGLAATSAWIALGALAPGNSVLMLGSVSAGKLRVVLFALVLSAVLAVLVCAAHRAVSARAPSWRHTVVHVTDLALLAVWAVLMLGCAIVYGLEPDQHRFHVRGDSRDFLLSSQKGVLISSETTSLHLFTRDGSLYVDTGISLPRAETASFESKGFEIEYRSGTAYIVYASVNHEQVEVAVPKAQ
jgi:hypothetical protein